MAHLTLLAAAMCLGVDTLNAAPPGAITADPLPAGAVAQFGSYRFSNSTMARAAAFSPDGKFFATGAGESVSVWDSSTGRLVRNLWHHGHVYDLRWRADGELVAISRHDDRYLLMQSLTNAPETGPTEALKKELKAMEKRIEGEYFGESTLSADGHWVVVVMGGENSPRNRANIYRFTPNRSTATLTPDRQVPLPLPSGVGISGDGKFLFVHPRPTEGGPYKVLGIYLTRNKLDTPTWEREFEGRLKACRSTNGKQVVVVFQDHSTELWDISNGKLIRKLPNLAKYAAEGVWNDPGFELSADGKRLAAISRNPAGEACGCIVDTETGKELCILDPGPITRLRGSVRFSPDAKRIALIGEDAVRIWNAETGADACPIPGHRGEIENLAVAESGKIVVSTGADFSVRGWDPNTGIERWRRTFPQRVAELFSTPEGIVLQHYFFSGIDTFQLLDPRTGKSKPLAGPLGEATHPKQGMGQDWLIALAPDGKSVVTRNRKQPAFRIWSWPAGELIATVSIAPPERLRVSQCEGRFTADGKQFVVVMHYGNSAKRERYYPALERWDLATGKMLARSAAEGGSFLLSHAAGLLALSRDGVICDALTGTTIAKLKQANGKDVYLLGWSEIAALSPDGRVLAVTHRYSDEVSQFEVRSGRPRQVRTVKGRSPNGAWFLPDGRLITAEGAALVWDVRLRPHSGSSASAKELWTSIADPDPARAWPAMQSLAACKDAIGFLRAQMKPAPLDLEGELDRVFKGLDAANFRDREAASAKLDRLGSLAVAGVTARMAKPMSQEARTRAERFLMRHDGSEIGTEELRALRAVEVLEAIGTADARKVLEELAGGAPSALLTRDAAGAVRRLRDR